jgi:hypothetical protein
MTDTPTASHKGFTLTYSEGTDTWSAPKVDMEAATLTELRAKLDTLTAIGTPGLPVIYVSRGLTPHEVKYLTASRAANQREHSTKVLVSDENGDVWPVESRGLILDTPENREEISDIQLLMEEVQSQRRKLDVRESTLRKKDRDILFSLSPQKTANQTKHKG